MIRVYGPYNTGTNLMRCLLTFILRKRTKRVEENKKHNLDKKLLEEFLNKDKYNRIIVMYRPILSWLKSLEKECYELNYTNIYSKNLKFIHCGRIYPHNKKHYEDIFDLYNTYYNLYFELKEKYGERVVFINYEKLISPEFNKYNEYLKSKFPKGDFNEKEVSQIFNKPAKNHGKPVKTVNQSYEKFQKDINSWTDDEKKYIFDKIKIDLEYYDSQ